LRFQDYSPLQHDRSDIDVLGGDVASRSLVASRQGFWSAPRSSGVRLEGMSLVVVVPNVLRNLSVVPSTAVWLDRDPAGNLAEVPPGQMVDGYGDYWFEARADSL
jgi:hypothetical protein